MDDIELPHEVTLAVVWANEDMIELEAVVGVGRWSGRSRAYFVPQDFADFATALQHFADGVSAEAEFAGGADTGIGLIALRFYKVGRAGHIACHIRLATGWLSNDHRPEEIFRLCVEVRTEIWAVLNFARQLAEIGRTLAGNASLKIWA